MSSRALRRLERERGARPLEEQEAASSSSDDAPARRRPAFAALAPESDEFSDGDLPEPIADSACAHIAALSDVSDTHTERESGTADPNTPQSPEPSVSESSESEDALLERMLREKMTVQNGGDESAEDQLAALLRVDAAQLDAAAEMRRKLGQAGRPARLPAVRRPGTRRVPPVVEPRPAWPSTTLASIGLELRVLERSDASDAEELVLVPSAEYSRAFETLAALVEAADIEGVYELVRAHPAHVEAVVDAWPADVVAAVRLQAREAMQQLEQQSD